MYNFGKAPPRSFDGFGVAGLLGEDGKVFYGSLFTTRHIGRVSDLIAASLLEEGLDELRLRAVLLFGAFEVFRAQAASVEEASKVRLPEPLVVECGYDDEKIAVGVSYTVEDGKFPNLEGMAQRISERKPENDFETLLVELHANSDRVIVRGRAGVRRLEIVALMGIPGKMDPAMIQERPPVEVCDLDQRPVEEAPQVKSYIELGDLDYPELLRESAPGVEAAPSPTGEVLVQGLLQQEKEEIERLAGERIAAEVETKVAGNLQTLEGSTKVSGNVVHLSGDLVRVKGTPAPVRDSDVYKISGGSADAGAAGSYGTLEGGAEKPVSSNIEAEISKEEIAQAVEEDVEEVEEEEAEPPTGMQAVLSRIKSVWPFRKKEDSAEVVDLGSKNKEKAASPESDTSADELAMPVAAPVVEAAPTVDIGAASNSLAAEIQAGIERAIAKAVQDAAALKKDLANPRAKRWMEGLMSELVAEKSRLHESAKKLNASIRSKELEFRNKEQALSEELRRRDDLLRQKNNSLGRVKDELTQATMSVERLRSSKQGSTSEDAHLKQKLILVQKMLASAKTDNATLEEKVEELKGQLMSAQLGPSKRNQPSMADFAALQTRYDRAVRQGEEFKKANQQLIDKLTETKKERHHMVGDDSKKRLEAAMKLAATHEKENERLSSKVEEMKKEQMRLQGELNRSQADLKTIKRGLPRAAPPVSAVPPRAAAASTKAAPAKKVAPGTAVKATPTDTGSDSGSGSDSGGGQSSPPKAA